MYKSLKIFKESINMETVTDIQMLLHSTLDVSKQEKYGELNNAEIYSDDTLQKFLNEYSNQLEQWQKDINAIFDEEINDADFEEFKKNILNLNQTIEQFTEEIEVLYNKIQNNSPNFTQWFKSFDIRIKNEIKDTDSQISAIKEPS